jgi:formamidopyrimidine-DNA glycosylase
MVEGHSVHRLASAFRSKLVGRKFNASSPNGRFTEGASVIHGRTLMRMEAVGKNLFAFFAADAGGRSYGTKNDKSSSNDVDDVIVVHVHFGMSGVWAIYDTAIETEPETKPTTRLRLEEECGSKKNSNSNNQTRFITHLSAMTVTHGPTSLYTNKKELLGEDPLRNDANPDKLYARISQSKKSIGALIMDQSYFAGPGNIYRAEILFVAGVYPTVPGNLLDRDMFDKVWDACVKLLQRGYDTGSILTVDEAIDPNVAARGERRYIYNRSTCARCGSKVSSWDMGGRTCYACEGGVCQPKTSKMLVSGAMSTTASSNRVPVKFAALEREDTIANKKSIDVAQHVPFISHCAQVSYKKRLEEGGAKNLTIAEIRSTMLELIGHQPDDINAAVKSTLLPSKNASKSAHVKALEQLLEEQRKTSNTEHTLATPRRKAMLSLPPAPPRVSAEDAAREKLLSGENRGVEHIAELSREQAMRALSSVVTPSLATKKRGGQKIDSIVTPSPATKKRGSRINDVDDVDNTIGDDRKERVERRRRL